MPLNAYANQCTAKSKRSGKRCLNPAVRDYTVCRMHGARGGAPKRNRNAIKHGNETAVFRAYRSLCRARKRILYEKLRLLESARVRSNRFQRAIYRADRNDPRNIRRLFSRYGGPEGVKAQFRLLETQYFLLDDESNVLDDYITELEAEVYAMWEQRRNARNSTNTATFGEKSKTTPCKEDGMDIYVTVEIEGESASVLDWILTNWRRFYQAQRWGNLGIE